MAMAYSTSTRLLDKDSENIPETNKEVSPSRRNAWARATPSSSSASLSMSASGVRWSVPSSSRTRSDSVWRKPDRRFARYSSVVCWTLARWFSTASVTNSRKKSWIDWAERTFGAVIHTSSIHLGGGMIRRQVRNPLDRGPFPVTLAALWHSPLSSASPTSKEKTHEDSASAGSRHRQ